MKHADSFSYSKRFIHSHSSHICLIRLFQFWSAYVPCAAAQLNAVQLSLEQIDVIRRLAEMNAQHLTLVTSVKGERSI